MSAVLESSPSVSQAAKPALTEALYTICPVLSASNVAVELGWLDEEFKRAGAKATYLRSLPGNAGWLPHYTHSLHPLFRDGGSIPTIQVKADLQNTKLIGLTWAQSGGQILVRVNSGINRVADLKGRRFGLFKSLNAAKIDFARATAERGIELALQLNGLKRNDVLIIDLEDADDPHFLQPSAKPAELWSQLRGERALSGAGKIVQALRESRIDAIYSQPGQSDNLVATGEFKIIEDLARHPDWTLQVANGPYTNAVSADLAEKHPEVVIAFLRASIRAGRWINANPAAAVDIFLRVTHHNNARVIAEAVQKYDFIPNLSARNLAATAIQKDWLRSHGYVKKDFEVQQWADSRFLEEAHRSL
jgi:ABC-type nitrate/sulfonate/bicarbonate transport system substrate-binding protein